jgi:beta-glucanase (GH16 family)
VTRGAAQDWQLVWNDEFGGHGIDPAKWEHEVRGDGGGNNELQYYTDRPENSFVRDGRLVIRALREEYRGRHYTSARLRTRYRGDWTYGRFEARVRLPGGRGLWPAVWLLPTDEEYGGWAASGEIDILELRGDQPRTVYGTLHYGGSWPDNVQSGAAFTLEEPASFVDQFHVFALEWFPGEIRWYVDGAWYQTQTQWHTAGAPFPAPFDRRFHLIVNVAVGGTFPGNPDETTQFPQELEIDFVRVYQGAVVRPPGGQIPGDANQDGALDLSDAVTVLLLLFSQPGPPMPCDGLSPDSEGNRTLLDVNGDRAVTIADAVYTLAHLFAGGAVPARGVGCVPVAGCPDRCALDPGLEVTQIPACGSDGDLQGRVYGLAPAAYRLTAYVRVCGAWWGPKPTFAAPLTRIGPSGAWQLDFTTGGSDAHADAIAVAVVAAGAEPPPAAGLPELPAGLSAISVLQTVVNRDCPCP